MKKFFQILTLEAAIISVRRKRQFILSTLLFFALVAFVNYGVEFIQDVPYAIKVLAVVMYSLITNIVISIIRILIVSGHRKRRNILSDDHDNFTIGLNALVNIATLLAIILFIFIVFDIEFRSFLSSVAIFAVALVLIFQDAIKNFLIGFSIMFSADYEIGDYIQVGSMPKGVVRNVTFSELQLKTEAGDVLYIPNSVVRENQIVNFSKLKPKRINSEFRLLRTQVDSVDRFEKMLMSHLDKAYPNTFELEKCHVYVKESNVDEVIFTLEAPTKKASLKLREQINHTVQKFAVEYK